MNDPVNSVNPANNTKIVSNAQKQKPQTLQKFSQNYWAAQEVRVFTPLYVDSPTLIEREEEIKRLRMNKSSSSECAHHHLQYEFDSVFKQTTIPFVGEQKACKEMKEHPESPEPELRTTTFPEKSLGFPNQFSSTENKNPATFRSFRGYFSYSKPSLLISTLADEKCPLFENPSTSTSSYALQKKLESCRILTAFLQKVSVKLEIEKLNSNFGKMDLSQNPNLKDVSISVSLWEHFDSFEKKNSEKLSNGISKTPKSNSCDKRKEMKFCGKFSFKKIDFLPLIHSKKQNNDFLKNFDFDFEKCEIRVEEPHSRCCGGKLKKNLKTKIMKKRNFCLKIDMRIEGFMTDWAHYTI